MSAETLRRAVAEIREDWPSDREMGMDRQEWRFHRAVAAWLDWTAVTAEFGIEPPTLALTVARAYLGES